MSIQLARANSALGKPTATPWLETITPRQIAMLLTWTGDTTKNKEQKRDCYLWINVIEAACQRGELASTAVTETKEDVFASIWAAYDTYDAGPQYREVTSYHIKPQDAARWLEGQGQPPGELLAAWFKAQGVGVAAVEMVAPPAPAAQPEAVLMPSPATAMTRTGMVKAFKNRWPTIESDLRDAARNGLSVARAGKRGWDECKALEWARARGKLHMESIEPTPEPADPMAAHFGRLSKLPSHRHGG